MTVMIIFATVEGQTGKIASFIADKVQASGSGVVMIDADGSDQLSFENVERVILAAPVHERRHPRLFEALLSGNITELHAIPTLLLSVSLSAAFDEGLPEAKEYLWEMEMRTGFTPTFEACVAGAVKSSSYDYFAAQIVHHVVLRDRNFDPNVKEHEFTDWPKLALKVDEFLSHSTGTESVD